MDRCRYHDWVGWEKRSNTAINDLFVVPSRLGSEEDRFINIGV